MWRKRRGMTQAVLADLAGMSQGNLSRTEAGDRPLDRKSTQLAVAAALNITVAQLLGQPDDSHTDPVLNRAAAHVPALRATLVELAAGERRTPIRSVDVARGEVRKLTTLRNAADYAAMVVALPGVLVDVFGHGEVLGPELVEALFGARFALRSLGEGDLAMTAAQIGVNVGRGLSPAWSAQAMYSYVQAFPPENAGLGVRLVQRTADGLQGETDRDSREMYGCLHVLAAYWAAIGGRAGDAHAHLDESASVAASVGEPVAYGPLSAGFNANWFGPTQVDFWRIAVAAELGEPGEAIDVSSRIDLGLMPVPNRHVYYWTDLARALAVDGKPASDVRAMHALARAERAAPQHFRANPVVKDLAGTLVRRARRRAVGADMAALARRLGIDPL